MSALANPSPSAASSPESARHEVHVEHLLGHRLRDCDGKSLGRIEEMIAEVSGGQWRIVEFHIGPGAVLERLGELSMVVPGLGRLKRHWYQRYRVPWHQLDFTDPSRPRTSVRRTDLERIDP